MPRTATPSLLLDPCELEQLIAFLRDAAEHHRRRPESTGLETALRCLPRESLAELVALADCGRLAIGRTLADVEELVRLGIGSESNELLVRKLLDPAMIEFIGVGLERIADLPVRAGPVEAQSQLRRRRETRPIAFDDGLSEAE